MPHEFTNEIEICTTQIQVCGKWSSCRVGGNECPFFSAYISSCLIQLHSFVYAYVFANNPYCFIECYVGNFFTCKVVRLIIFNDPFNDRRQWNFRPCVAFLWHIGQSFACSYMDNMFMYLGYFAKKAAFNVVFMISCSLRSNKKVRKSTADVALSINLYTAIWVVRRGLCRCYGLSVYRSFGHPFWASKRAKNGKNAYTRSGALLVRAVLF